MKMGRCTAAILLMLSLEALVAGRLSAAVADDGVDTIRLPSHGLADEIVAAARESGGSSEKKRPWKCCDVRQCNRRMPPGCRCMDAVERCDEACSRCEAYKPDPSKFICMDRYIGYDSGPACTSPGNVLSNGGEDAEDVPNAPGVAGHEATAAAVEEESRPWECCDLPRCTRSFPPTCSCMDKVKKCAKTCKVCKKAGASSPSRYVCLDSYFGWPGPNCTRSAAASGTISPEEHVEGRCRWPHCVNHGSGDGDDVPNGIAAAQPGVAAAAAEAVSEESVVDGEEEARPWKCCDDTLCTRSAPPTCQCLDKVKKCAKTCKVCEKAGASSRYVCRDRYFGWPGPKCRKSVAAGDRRGN